MSSQKDLNQPKSTTNQKSKPVLKKPSNDLEQSGSQADHSKHNRNETVHEVGSDEEAHSHRFNMNEVFVEEDEVVDPITGTKQIVKV